MLDKCFKSKIYGRILENCFGDLGEISENISMGICI